MRCFAGRVLAPEILDTLHVHQARRSLADLTRITRHWGGHSTLRHLLRENVRPGESFSMLDVGAASGDMGDCVRRWYPAARVTSLDRIPSHLKAASGLC